MGAHPMRAVLSLAMAALLALSAGCGKAPSLSSLTGGGQAEQPKEPAGMKAVSPVEPQARQPIEFVAAFPNLELAPSQGDCAPRYANGQTGTCINSRPCRGLGMRTARGAAECRCWAVAGGCSEGERCDGVTKACVPESRADSGRADAE
jgi:hypothetical protein